MSEVARGEGLCQDGMFLFNYYEMKGIVFFSSEANGICV